MPHRHEQDRTEAQVSEALRQLPLRRAPATLALRVLTEIERRAALPWWRRSFGHWPPPARIGFVLACLALIAGIVAAARSSHSALGELPAHPLMAMPGVSEIHALLSSGSILGTSLMNAMPPGWIYLGLALGAMLYALLFGLGAAIYRAFFLPQSVSV